MKKFSLLLLAAMPLFAQTKFDRSRFEIRHEKFVSAKLRGPHTR